MRTNLQTSSRQQEVVAYFAKAVKYYRDKELLVVSLNTTMYDKVWYCDSSRPTDLITSDCLTRDWIDVMVVLNE
jgi:hypothetical protein